MHVPKFVAAVNVQKLAVFVKYIFQNLHQTIIPGHEKCTQWAITKWLETEWSVSNNILLKSIDQQKCAVVHASVRINSSECDWCT